MDQHGYDDQHDGDGGGEVPLEPKFLKKFDINCLIFNFMHCHFKCPLIYAIFTSRNGLLPSVSQSHILDVLKLIVMRVMI